MTILIRKLFQKNKLIFHTNYHLEGQTMRYLIMRHLIIMKLLKYGLTIKQIGIFNFYMMNYLNLHLPI